jgi:DNA polymerase-3 subunit gamma/tau
MTAAIARSCALVQVDGQHYQFDLDPDNSALYNDAQRQRLQEALASVLGPVQVAVEVRPVRGETPDQRRQRLQQEAWHSASQALLTDPALQQVLERFDASIDENSIQPQQPG